MLHRGLSWILLATALAMALALPAMSLAGTCHLTRLPPMPVTMDDLQPVVAGTINGAEARFIVDTGSFRDFLSPAAAAHYNLNLTYAPAGYLVTGVGGFVQPKLATVKSFSVGGMPPHEAQFLVGDNDFGGGIAGIVGENLFHVADVEYDFANGTLRFIQPHDCKKTVLAYWAADTQPVSTVDLDWITDDNPFLIGNAQVNGRTVRVLFDSGSAQSILSLEAAKRAGMTPASPGVVAAGDTLGVGQNVVKVWSAPVAEFIIGDEKIEHTRVLIGDIAPGLSVDMLLGSDFFLSHHMYAAISQGKLYFTYNGGPVFDLNARRRAGPAAVTASPGPADAAGFLRRGMAHVSRGELADALSDLTRACDLAPKDSNCRYQRGLVYWRNHQPGQALADFSAAIQLDPGDFRARLERARLELRNKQGDVTGDLAAADRLAPRQADERLALARVYEDAGDHAGAVRQYGLWIDNHADDVRVASALSERCWAEAAGNLDLDRAVEDCSKALHLMSSGASAYADTLSDRSLAYLREGKLDRAIADGDAAIRLQPEDAYALYQRGLAEVRQGLKARGQTDMAAAQKLQPDIARQFGSLGLTP